AARSRARRARRARSRRSRYSERQALRAPPRPTTADRNRGAEATLGTPVHRPARRARSRSSPFASAASVPRLRACVLSNRTGRRDKPSALLAADATNCHVIEADAMRHAILAAAIALMACASKQATLPRAVKPIETPQRYDLARAARH